MNEKKQNLLWKVTTNSSFLYDKFEWQNAVLTEEFTDITNLKQFFFPSLKLHELYGFRYVSFELTTPSAIIFK